MPRTPIKLENVGIAVRDLEATIASIIVMLAEELKESRPGADPALVTLRVTITFRLLVWPGDGCYHVLNWAEICRLTLTWRQGLP